MYSHIIKPHISRQFDEEIQGIRHKVLSLGGLVEQQLVLGARAFISCETALAEQVVAANQQLNVLVKEIDHECTDIIARRQPTASDLRMLIATIKMITDLERIGAESLRIARMTLRLDNQGDFEYRYHEIEHLLGLVKDMLSRALDAYARCHVDDVLDITGQDLKVDREYTALTRQLILLMMENPKNITRSLDMMWTARALERIGDHACNVCEQVIYMVSGKDVRHLSREELERLMSLSR
jgi:phosphate transport system protein